MDSLKKFEKLKKSFEDDGFQVIDLNQNESLKKTGFVNSEHGFLNYYGKIGILAQSKTAAVGKYVYAQYKKGYKKTFYVEGSPYEMGFLLGLMAEKEVAEMTTKYAENVIPDFFNIKINRKSKILNHLKEILIDLLGQAAEKMEKDLPSEIISELVGILNGCNLVNPDTEVDSYSLKALNFGIDYLVSHIYTGTLFQQKKTKIHPALLRVPIMCNAISLCGNKVKNNSHFFGRDFMFPTADIFQDVACLIIYNPLNFRSTNGKKGIPMISQTAPGFVGSIAALNKNGVAMGVNMLPSSHCNPQRPGLNSLLMVRHCIQYSSTIDDVIQTVIDAPRGVSWLYPVADGQSEKSCIIEAACNTGDAPFDYYQDIPDSYKKYLPSENFFKIAREQHHNPKPVKGLMVREDTYSYPDEFIREFNKKLWNAYNKDLRPKFFRLIAGLISLLFDSLYYTIKDIVRLPKIIYTFIKEFKNIIRKKPYSDEYFKRGGFINRTWKNQNCPGPFYFAPQRETSTQTIIAGNHFITPEMRLTSMTEWITILQSNDINEFQWRYDKINEQIQTIFNNEEIITRETAQHLIDFLRPTEDNPDPVCREFYNHGFKKDPKKIIIEGSTSLFELKNKIIRSHFGYHGDEWIEIHFSKFIV